MKAKYLILIVVSFISMCETAFCDGDTIFGVSSACREFLKTELENINKLLAKSFSSEIQKEKQSINALYKKIKRHSKYDKSAQKLLKEFASLSDPKTDLKDYNSQALLESFAGFAIDQDQIIQEISCPQNYQSVVKLVKPSVSTSIKPTNVESTLYYQSFCASGAKKADPTEVERVYFSGQMKNGAFSPELLMCRTYSSARGVDLSITESGTGVKETVTLFTDKFCVVKDLKTGKESFEANMLMHDRTRGALVPLAQLIYEAAKDSTLECAEGAQAMLDIPQKKIKQKNPVNFTGKVAI